MGSDGLHFEQSQLSLRAFPLASKSKPKAIAAAKASARIMPSIKRDRRESRATIEQHYRWRQLTFPR
jgi:hypothetical protein